MESSRLPVATAKDEIVRLRLNATIEWAMKEWWSPYFLIISAKFHSSDLILFERTAVPFSTKKMKNKDFQTLIMSKYETVTDRQRFFEISAAPLVFQRSNSGVKAFVTPALSISYRHRVVQEQSEQMQLSEKSRTDGNGETLCPLKNQPVTWIFPEQVFGKYARMI